MYIDFGKTPGYEAITINGQLVDQVQSYRYLGTIIDYKLNFQENCEAVCKKGTTASILFEKIVPFSYRQDHDDIVLSCFYRNYCVFLPSGVVWLCLSQAQKSPKPNCKMGK